MDQCIYIFTKNEFSDSGVLKKSIFKRLFGVLDNLRCILSVSIHIQNYSAGSCNETENILFNATGQGLSCSL